MAAQPRRPAQPAASGTRGRILRIGVLLGGKIVEERLIRERSAVSIGQSMKNTFSIPVEGLPLEFTLFALEEGKYYLQFLAKMDGRLSDSAGQVNTLDALKQRGAQNQGGHWRVPLGDSARGKLSLGDLTILFQFVVEPPRQPKPMLPASVRGSFADRFDPRLSVIMGSSIIAHFAIVIAALLGDLEEEGMAERAYNMTFKQDFQVELQKPDAVVTPNTGSAAGSAAKVEKKPDKPASKTPPRVDTGGGRNEKETVAMNEDDASKFADLLTGEGPNGTSEGDMSRRRPGADLGAQINDVREGNKTVAIGGGTGRGSRGDGSARVGTGTGPKIAGPGEVESAAGGKTTEKVPTGRISVSSKSTDDDSSLTPDEVLKKINGSYMTGIKRCYTTFLKKEATARGAVKLSFEVNPTGRALGGKASGFSDEVDACISGLMATWRFGIPKDKDGEATSASFQITLQLVPD